MACSSAAAIAAQLKVETQSPKSTEKWSGVPTAAVSRADSARSTAVVWRPADGVDDREPGAGRVLGVVLIRLGIAETDQHAIAHILADKTAKAGDGVGHAAVVGADDLAQILEIEARGQRRRTHQIAKYHPQLPPLGGILRRHTGRCRWRRQCLGGQTGDGSEETLAVPERHTKRLEIDVGQLRQDIGVDLARAKERLILAEAETFEPTPTYTRAPRAPNGSSFG